MTAPFLQSLDTQATAAGCAAVPPTPVTAEQSNLPQVFLPGGGQTITAAATVLGRLLGQKQTVFNRGGTTCKVSFDSAGLPVVEPVRPAAFASIFEEVAQLVRWENKKGSPMVSPATCNEQAAKLIVESPVFKAELPPLKLVSPCAVLLPQADGGIRQMTGYDRETGIYASGREVPDMPLQEAIAMLKELDEGFRFATPGDHARSQAAFITPALVFGGLLRGRAPLDVGEADEPQSGKGYRMKVKAAVYGQPVHAVSFRKSGVGGLEEGVDRLLIKGASFISLDNVRGTVDSQSLESLLTEDSYHARALYCDSQVETSRVLLHLTSNGAQLTADLSKRSSVVRIRKQPAGYKYREYPEGDLLDHVRANQPAYLGAVFAVVREWWRMGCPRTNEGRHDFRVWARTLDWICVNLLGTAPLLDGHEEVQTRVSSHNLGWLRSLAVAVQKAGRGGLWLTTTNLVDIGENSGTVDTPDDVLPQGKDNPDKVRLQAYGRRLKRVFSEKEVLVLDEFSIHRKQELQPRERPWMGGPIQVNTYLFTFQSQKEGVPIRASDQM